MNSEIIVAIISLFGTLGGSLGGILVSSKITTYRIEQLEKKVDKHNHFAERIPLIDEQIKMTNHRIDDLEKESHHA
jgi:ABC-type lipoprotein release transport system permease subunit